MPRADRYVLIDEPAPGPLAQLTVSPTFPMFAFMLGGAGLGWLWFALNAHAFGSASRLRETLIAVLSPALIAGLVFGLEALHEGGWLGLGVLRYAFLAIVVLKVATAYWLFSAQQRSFELFAYYGGKVRNGLFVLLPAAYLGRKLLFDMPAWLKVVLW